MTDSSLVELPFECLLTKMQVYVEVYIHLERHCCMVNNHCVITINTR